MTVPIRRCGTMSARGLVHHPSPYSFGPVVSLLSPSEFRSRAQWRVGLGCMARPVIVGEKIFSASGLVW